MKKFKNICLIMALISIMFCMSGCGTFAVDYPDTTLIFKKNGAVTDVIVESFSADYYTLDGLNTYFNEAISEFSVKDGKGTVSLTELSVEDEIARAVLDFDNADTYKRFYDVDFFYGTVSDAYDAGYSMDVILKSTDSEETIGKNELMNMGDAKILITEEKICVKMPYKFKYASANVEMVDSKYARISSDSSGLAYMIVEK